MTELSGDLVSHEQVERSLRRYAWAARHAKGLDVLEVACGSGQGLGLLDASASRLVAGDISRPLVARARRHYGGRVPLLQLDAQCLPFPDASMDVVLCFEALYYVPSAEAFVSECRRVLRPGGVVLMTTANKDLYDFNPSRYSHVYHGPGDLERLFAPHRFTVELFGDTPVDVVSFRQRILRPVKFVAVKAHLVPRSMKGKRLIKRLMFGELVEMPAELQASTSSFEPPVPIPAGQPDHRHKVIYCIARKEKA